MNQLLRIFIAFCIITTRLCDMIRENGYCSYEIDYSNCVYNVECNRRYEFPFYKYKFYHNICNTELSEVIPGVIYQGNTYPQVNLMLNIDGLLSVSGTYGAHIISTLDLSGNRNAYYPTIPYMENLRKLNMSHNEIIQARLSNENELISLAELDLSHNEITSITENENYFAYSNLRVLNLAHNLIEIITDSIFHSLLQLEHLDLSYNVINTLSVLTFEGLKNILYLNLSHNVITELNLSLVRFRKLQELDLSNNQISHLLLNDFKNLVNLKKLDVSSNGLLDIEKNLFDTMLFLHTVDLQNNALSNIESEFLNTSLENVNLSKNRLTQLPPSMFKDKNITTFSIQENNLQGALKKGTFDGMSLVDELDLSYEKLTSIEDYSFIGLDNVKVILLNNNNINSIGNNSFRGVSNLETLDLSVNQLTRFDISTDDLKNLKILFLHHNLLVQVTNNMFKNLGSLTRLDISYNNISLIQDSCFKPLNNLVSLQFSHNTFNLTVLKESTFAGMKSLPDIDISGITVHLIQNNSFKGMTKLKEVLISQSNVSGIEFNAFYDTGALETLNLTNNKLTNFNINTTSLVNLSTLLLGNNLLVFIAPNTFKRLAQLTSIDLSNNLIETIDNNIFSDQKDIARLDLSYNPSLNSIPLLEKCYLLDISGTRVNQAFTKTFGNVYLIIANASISNITALNLKHFNDLEDLTLSYNEIVNVEVGSFSGLSTLTKLDLSCNKISVIQPGVFIDSPSLTFLNISHNALVSINYGIWRGIRHMHTIDISYNNIVDLEREKFNEIKTLAILIADSNKITYFNASEFRDSLSLIEVSIGNNPIPCQVLSKFRNEQLNFKITAIKLNVLGSENVDGIACISGSNKINDKENSESSEILSEIRDILRNMAINDKSKLNNTPDTSENKNKLEESILLKAIEDEKNKSGDLLNKILITITKSVNISRNLSNSNTNDNVKYADLESNFKDMKQYMSEFIDKFSALLSNKDTSNVANALSVNESKPKTKSFLFLEICVGSILLLLIACILFKLYGSVFKNNRPVFLSRRLSEEMENSDL